jgi:hypothetical protein
VDSLLVFPLAFLTSHATCRLIAALSRVAENVIRSCHPSKVKAKGRRQGSRSSPGIGDLMQEAATAIPVNWDHKPSEEEAHDRCLGCYGQP